MKTEKDFRSLRLPLLNVSVILKNDFDSAHDRSLSMETYCIYLLKLVTREIRHAEHGTKTGIIQRIVSSGMLRRVALVRTDVSVERIASIVRAKRRFLQEPDDVTSQKTAFIIRQFRPRIVVKYKMIPQIIRIMYLDRNT
jgi:hypothetical protein